MPYQILVESLRDQEGEASQTGSLIELFQKTINGDFQEANLSLKCIISVRDDRDLELDTGVPNKTHFLVTSITDTEGLAYQVDPFPSRLTRKVTDSYASTQAEPVDHRLHYARTLGVAFTEIEDKEALTLVDLVISTASTQVSPFKESGRLLTEGDQVLESRVYAVYSTMEY